MTTSVAETAAHGVLVGIAIDHHDAACAGEHRPHHRRQANPPPPKIAVAPAATFALLSTSPTPVVTPHPINAEISNGTSGIFTQLKAGTIECVAQVEIAAR